MPVVQLEPEFWDKNPNKIPSKIFPKDFQFKPIAPKKSQKFYEFILVDSDSVSVKHYKDKANPSNTTHSTFQILKVMTHLNLERIQTISKKFPKILIQLDIITGIIFKLGQMFFGFKIKLFAILSLFILKEMLYINFLIGSPNGGISLDQSTKSFQ